MEGRRELVIASLEKLSKGGSAAISVVQLAKAVGLSRSSLYKYYPDIVASIAATSSRGASSDTGQARLKISLLHRRLVQQKSLIDSLVTICSDQLIEIIENQVSYEDELLGLKLKINFIEQELAKLKNVGLKIVK